MEQKQPLQQMVLGDLDSYMHKKETRSPTYTIHKNKFKINKRLKRSHDSIKILTENIDGNISDISRTNTFADISPRAQENKGKK